MMLYGLAILGSGIFSAKPFIAVAPYSGQEAQIHEYLATAGGLFPTFGILLFMLTDKAISRRVIHTIALVLTPAISFSFFAMPAIGGLLQRLLLLSGSPGWIFLATAAG